MTDEQTPTIHPRQSPPDHRLPIPHLTLTWLAAAWIAGMASAAVFGGAAWPIALAIAAATLTVALVRRDLIVIAFAIVLPLIFAGAVLRHDRAQPHPSPDAAAHYNDGPAVRVRGVLRSDPDIGDTSQQFTVDVRELQLGGEWQRASGGVLVRTGVIPKRESGDVVELEGRLETPASDTGFDYADYLARRGIASTMQYPQVQRIGHEDDSIFRATVLHVRRKLSRGLALSLPEPQASLAQGVLLGQRSALPRDVADQLNATNTSHLVVVSGENVVLVSTFVTIVLAGIVGRRRALALSIAAVLAYAMLVGASPPVMRATIMGILLVIATLAGRPTSGLTSILFAAAIMCGLDPPVIRDVSFQLSFAATAGIVYLAAPLRRWIIEALAVVLRRDEVPRPLGHWFAEPLAVTLAAIVSTSPLLALNFRRVSLVAIPANLLIVPAFPLILLSSLVAALGGLLPAYRLFFAAPAQYALSYWLTLARWFAEAPHSATSVGGYSTPWTIATYFIVASITLIFLRLRVPMSHLAESRPFSFGAIPVSVRFAAPALVLATTLGYAFWPSPPRHLDVTVLDVGQGDAILIRTPRGDDILVDGGPGRAVLRGLGDELPWNDRDIELMVLTHPQADHVTGLLDVLDRYDVHRIIAGPGVLDSSTSHAWQRAVADEGVDLETARQGTTIDLVEGATLEVLAPDPIEARDPQINNTGAVLRIAWHDISFLLTADIEAGAETALLRDGVDLRATVLKVPHHGSATSSTRAFLDAVRPQVSVISAGKDNIFGLPNAAVVDRLHEYGDVYTTADRGAVHFTTDGHTLNVHTAR